MSHRFARRFPRRQPLFAHDALDVLHHHDGIVHQQADRQHHRKHGQGVDAVTKGIEHGKGAEQHDGNGDGRDERGAEVLQEQVHHEEHQCDGFEQRFHHVLNRGFYEGGGFIGNFVFQPMREILGQLIQAVDDQLRGRHFVRAGGQFYPDTRRLIAVKPAQVVVLFGAHFDGGDVAEPHFGTVLIHAQGDIAELLRRLEQGLRVDGGVQRLFIHRRRTAQLPDGDLRVLGFDGVSHIGGGHLHAVQLRRVQPDAHGIL
ncbi:hypothetical protein D3C72_442290 [compost metagenome]